MLKLFPSDKVNGTKIPSFFYCKLQLITFNLWFLHELRHKISLSTIACGIFHFRFCFVFISLYFCSTKCMDPLTLKRHNSFQNYNNTKAIHSFAPRTLVFTLQQKGWKFSNICVSWSFPKTDLVTNFLNLKNQSFETINFSQ